MQPLFRLIAALLQAANNNALMTHKPVLGRAWETVLRAIETVFIGVWIKYLSHTRISELVPTYCNDLQKWPRSIIDSV